MKQDIHSVARGRWRGILGAIGLDRRFLSGRHGPCPFCGGKDRFRWTDYQGSGGYICNKCGTGSGVDLVMKCLGVDFRAACREIMRHVGAAPVEVKARLSDDRDNSWFCAPLWGRSVPLSGHDPASRYLASRGLEMQKWPSQLRYCQSAPYRHQDGRKTYHHAMIARVHGASPDQWTLHVTYLTDDGRKADLNPCRKIAPGRLPDAAAVRLCNSAETMGVAEGIETALSAMQLFEVPVWACLSGPTMVKWRPPAHVRFVLVFADRDSSFAGQMYAYALAHRLQNNGGVRAEVRLPDLDEPDCDWNDALLSGMNVCA